MLRNMLGPIFNFNLDQLLTLDFCYFVFWAETPTFIVFSAKHAKLKETQKEKTTLFVNTPVLTVLVNMSVFFCIFSFAVLGKVQIVSRSLSGLFLVGALNRSRKRKRTNRENPWTIPEQIGKIQEKSGKPQKGQKRTKKEGQVQIGKPPRLKPPRLAA